MWWHNVWYHRIIYEGPRGSVSLMMKQKPITRHILTKLLWPSGIGAPVAVPAMGSSLGHCGIYIWAAASKTEDRYAVSHLVTFGSMLASVSSLDHHGGARILGYQKKNKTHISCLISSLLFMRLTNFH